MDKISSAYKNKLKNKLFALLCEREKNGEWESFLNNLIIEIFGNKSAIKTINYLELQSKMAVLRFLDYPYFRSTIFDCMSLLGDEDVNDNNN